MIECPHCGVTLSYEHEGKTYSRGIMVEVQGVYDGGLFWQCPDCAGRWHRWPEGHYLRAKAEKYVNPQPEGEAVKGTHSQESKERISEGRQTAIVVRRYLDAVTRSAPRQGRKRRTVEELDARIAEIDKALGATDSLSRLKLAQQRIDFERERDEAQALGQNEELEARFVSVAGEYGRKNGISYEAWVAVGVNPLVLANAGITKNGVKPGGPGDESIAT